MASGTSPILLVGDDDILAGLLTEILGTLGEIVWSPSAEDAEARLGLRHWDLIMADVELPGRTGIDVVERAKALHPLPPLLYVVGYGPPLAAMTAAAYVKELRGAEMRWEKTEKSGKVGEALQ
jgi:CheY-like chemotaxis protein